MDQSDALALWRDNFTKFLQEGKESVFKMPHPLVLNEMVGIEQLDVEREGNHVVLAQLKLHINVRKIKELLRDQLAEFWKDSQLIIDWVFTGSGQWVICEVTNQIFPAPILLGIHLKIQLRNDALEFHCDECFALGQSHKALLLEFYASLHKVLAKLFVPAWTQSHHAQPTPSLFLVSYPLKLLLPLKSHDVLKAKASYVTQYDASSDSGFITISKTSRSSQQSVGESMAILESRSMIRRYANFEALLLQGQTSDVYQDLQKLWQEHDGNLFFLRRLALIEALRPKATLIERYETGLAIEPHNPVFIAAIVNKLNNRNDAGARLRFLSKLGHYLAKQIKDIDSLQSLSYVLPYYLGKAWMPIDAQKAFSSFHRIEQVRGLEERVLRALIKSCEKLQNKEKELAYLEKLIPFLASGEEAAETFVVMANKVMAYFNDENKALQYLEQALDRNPLLSDALRLVSHILCEQERYDDAIHLLSSGVTEFEKRHLNDKAAQVHVWLGDIWNESLQRNDMAHLHYSCALELDPNNDLITNKARSFLGKNANQTDFSVNQSTNRGEKSELISSNLDVAAIYANRLQNYEKALSLLMADSKFCSMTISEVLSELNLDSKNIDIKKFYQAFLIQVESAPKIAIKQHGHLLLAEWARAYLKDNNIYLAHLEAAQRLGPIDPILFYRLLEQLEGNKEFHRMHDIIRIELKRKHGNDFLVQLKKRLFYLEDVTSDGEKDQLALELFSMDSKNLKLCKKRLIYYLEKNNPGKIEELINVLERKGASYLELNKILNELIDEKLRDDNRQELAVLVSLFKLRLKYCEDRVSVLQSAMRTLAKYQDDAMLEPFLDDLIEENQLPSGDLSRWVGRVKNKSKLVEVLLNTARKEKDDKLKKQLLGEAKNILSQVSHQKEVKADVLFELSQVQDLSLPELSELISYFIRKDENKVIKILEHQQVQVKNEQESYDLMGRLFEYQSHHLVPLDELRILLDLCKRKGWFAENIAVPYAHAVGERGSLKEAEAFLENLDEKEDFWHHQLFAFARQLEVNVWAEERLRKLVYPLFHKAMEQKKLPLAELLASKLFSYYPDDMDLQVMALYFAFKNFDQNIAKKIFVQLATGHQLQIQELMDLFGDVWRQVDSEFDLEDLWVYILDHIDHDFMPAGRNFELRLALCHGLLFSDQNAGLAYDQLFDLYKNYPHEKDVWLPLYLAMCDYGPVSARYELLKEILPVLRLGQDQHLFKRYPVSLENMEVDFRELAKRFEESLPLDKPAEAKKAVGDKELQSQISREVVEDVGVDDRVISIPNKGNQEINLKSKEKDRDGPKAQSQDLKDEPQKVQGNEEGSSDKRDFTIASFQKTGRGINWRQLPWQDLSPDIKPIAEQLMETAFSSQIEKHVALQTTALLTGNLEPLNHWQCRVWRNPEELDYPLGWRKRYQPSMASELLASPLQKLLQELSPVLVSLYPDRFRLSYLQKKLDVDLESLRRQFEPVSCDDPLFANSLMRYYKQQLERQRFKLVHLSRLKDQIFFEGETRSIYFDKDYFSQRPATVLFYRLYMLLWSVKLRYFVPLQLHPVQQLKVALKRIQEFILADKVSKLTGLLGLGSNRDIAQAIVKCDENEVRRLFEQVESIHTNDLLSLASVMKEHLYRMLIAETLDLVGVFEAILNEDLLDPAQKFSVGEIIAKSPYLDKLLEFASLMNLDE